MVQLGDDMRGIVTQASVSRDKLYSTVILLTLSWASCETRLISQAIKCLEKVFKEEYHITFISWGLDENPSGGDGTEEMPR